MTSCKEVSEEKTGNVEVTVEIRIERNYLQDSIDVLDKTFKENSGVGWMGELRDILKRK